MYDNFAWHAFGWIEQDIIGKATQSFCQKSTARIYQNTDMSTCMATTGSVVTIKLFAQIAIWYFSYCKMIWEASDLISKYLMDLNIKI